MARTTTDEDEPLTDFDNGYVAGFISARGYLGVPADLPPYEVFASAIRSLSEFQEQGLEPPVPATKGKSSGPN